MPSLFFRVLRFVTQPFVKWWGTHDTLRQLQFVKSLGQGVVVNGKLRLGNPSRVFFGQDVCVNPGLVVRGSGELRVGSHVHFGENVLIVTENHNYQSADLLPYDKVRIAKDVVIGDCVWICDRVTIVPGAKIGEGAILAAGAVVTKDVPPFAIAGGSPAVVIGYRDSEVYRNLKTAQKFLGWPRNYDLINGRRLQIRRRRIEAKSL